MISMNEVPSVLVRGLCIGFNVWFDACLILKVCNVVRAWRGESEWNPIGSLFKIDGFRLAAGLVISGASIPLWQFISAHGKPFQRTNCVYAFTNVVYLVRLFSLYFRAQP